MTNTLEAIAKHIGGRLDGDGDHVIDGVASLEDAGDNDISFAEKDRYRDKVERSNAGAFVVSETFPEVAGKRLLRVGDARFGFLKIMELFAVAPSVSGVHTDAVIDPSATLGVRVSIGANAVVCAAANIGDDTIVAAGAFVGPDVTIGAACRIGPNVSVLDGCTLGDRVVVHPGTVIGADGFGFQWLGDHHHKIPQLGTVVVESDVEIGANACVDRATMGVTRIRSGTKIDNLVQIAHNVDIGYHAVLVSQVGLSGSVRIGNGAVLGGQVGVADHLEIGDRAQIGAQAGVTCAIAPGETVWGTPSRPIKRVLKEQALTGRLPDMRKTLKMQTKTLEELRARVAELEARVSSDNERR
jgi:UDP-3-O-[3-hydroxymyristoyl] glucosamine N-acyltransferase